MARFREPRWLLLIHQIPPNPAYLRVKIGRRLQKIGAVAVKNSVYVLPNTDEAQEQFAWVAREIADGRGDSSICESSFIGERSAGTVEALFVAARAADFARLVGEAQTLQRTLGRKRRFSEEERADGLAGLARIRRRLTEVLQIDFFGAPGRETLEGLLVEIERRFERPATAESTTEDDERTPRPHKATWVTRAGIHVDRMASAWLIRRFIDSEANFKFVAGKGYKPEPGELRFDMFEAEYTHEGDACTFEVLLRRFTIADPALTAIAEVVHDIDLRDHKFERPEVAGVERLVTGVAAGQVDDERRLAAAIVLFEGLYEGFKRRKG